MSVPTLRFRFNPDTPRLRARVYPAIPPLEASFRSNGTHIQWRLGVSGAWQDFIPLTDLEGPVASIVPGTGIDVDESDLSNPVVSVETNLQEWNTVNPSADGKTLVAAADYAAMRALTDTAVNVATRTALKALDTTKDVVAFLTEAGREGTFVWKTGDYSAEVTADTAEGIYIEADDTAASSGAWVREYDGLPQARWFGADPSYSGSVNGTAFTGIESLASTIGMVALADGVFATNLTTSALPKSLHGPGQVQDAAGKRGPIFLNQTAAPSSFGDTDSVLTAFDGDLSRVALAIEKRTTGSTTLGQPSTGYQQDPENAAVFVYSYNSSGHNDGTADNDGRTGSSPVDIRVTQAGQGDFGAIHITGIVSSAKFGATSFLASPAVYAINGGLFAGIDGAYLNIMELNATDNGFDAAAIGVVFNFDRSVGTAALDEVWMGVRPQSVGSADADVGYSLGGKWKRGIDFSAATLSADLAAIVLTEDQRFYWDATPSGDVAWSQTLGTTYDDFDGTHRRVVVDGVEVLKASSTGVELPTGKIKFPSTASPSADPNTLDEYQEETWTPTLTCDTPGDLSVTYSTRTGTVTKTGRHVHCQFEIVTSAFSHSTASGTMQITGLPYTAGSLRAIGSAQLSGITKASYTQFVVQIVPGGTSVSVACNGSAVPTTAAQITDFPTGGSVIIRGTIDYDAAN